MRTKLLLLVMFAMSNTLFAQTLTVGDYRSAGPGPALWNNAASWQVYVGAGIWEPATYYPGQMTGGEYDIEIQVGHTITNPNVTNPIDGTLTINGTLRLTTNQKFYLSTTAVIVTQNQGQIYFDGQADLHLPANTSLTVFNNGLMPNQGQTCSASRRIYIGTFLLASCNGMGQAYFPFSQLTNLGGTLYPFITYTNPDCNTVILNANYLGTAGTPTNFVWTITPPSEIGLPYNSAINESPLILDVSNEGVYNITLSYTTTIGTTQTVTNKLEYDSRIYLWDGNNWLPDGIIDPIDPSTGSPWHPEIYSRTKILEGTTYEINYPPNSNAKSFSACNLIIENNTNVIIKPNTYIETQNEIANSGSLEVKNSGSLVQIADNGNATFTNQGTNAISKVHRTSRNMVNPVGDGTNFVYWGSPITDTNVKAQIPPAYFDPLLGYQWNTNGAQAGTWGILSNNLERGRGFITGVKEGITLPQAMNFVFTGTLNSGTVDVPVNVYGPTGQTGLQAASGNMVLLGNPYPSAIDARTFVTHNQARQVGTLYFWTSVSIFNSAGNWQYNQQDYAAWNMSGGASGPATSNDTNLIPKGYIASGQGFFAEVYVSGNIQFTNAMRTRGFEFESNPDNYNGQFFRTTNENASSETTEAEKHRLWINLSNGKELNRKMMFGYIEGASNGFDPLYDGKSFTANEIDIYTVLENKQLAIQGRALPFTTNDIIPLGVKIGKPGVYTITISEADGLFTANDEIYLKDKTTNTFHNLKKGAYEFNAQAGTFNDRFEIHFKEPSKESNPIASENNILIYGAEGALQVNSYGTNIQSIEVFDLVGKRIYVAQEVNNDRFVSPSIKGASPFLIARVTLTNQQVITKKIIIQ